MSSVGIITYHAAYNFGSVLQAYATQRAVEKLGHRATIINYRPATQRNYYELYRWKISPKFLIKDLTMLPVQQERRLRQERYEEFISGRLKLTEKEYIDRAELAELSDSFDTYISGSDQIINKHSNELESDSWEAMDPYLLMFTDRRKVSYASSPANMTAEDMKRISPKLARFDALSAREPDAAKIMRELTGKKVETVLDPTLLLDGTEWAMLADDAQCSLPKDFVLYYTLDGTNKLIRRRRALNSLSNQMGLPILMLTPFAYIPQEKGLLSFPQAGPCEFLNAVRSAALVVTDSYHGTLFSINFGTRFLSICDSSKSAARKTAILDTLGLQAHRIQSIEAAHGSLSKARTKLRYSELVNQRSKSFEYLENALGPGDKRVGLNVHGQESSDA